MDDFNDNVEKAFGNLRQDSDFNDVTLVSEDGQNVEAHKVILASSSRVSDGSSSNTGTRFRDKMVAILSRITSR